MYIKISKLKSCEKFWKGPEKHNTRQTVIWQRKTNKNIPCKKKEGIPNVVQRKVIINRDIVKL